MIHAGERGVQAVVVALRDRIELVIVAPAQPTVRPRNASPVARIISSTVSARICAACTAS